MQEIRQKRKKKKENVSTTQGRWEVAKKGL